MTDSPIISEVRTGKGLDGARAAIIAAAPDAKAGSLQSLTRFFQEKDISVQPGYTGQAERHVLRLHGLASDSALKTMLQKEYPAWEKSRTGASAIRFPENLHFSDLAASPAQQKQGFIETLRGKSTDISATAYMAGNIGLVFSALYGNKGSDKPREWLKLGAPVSYTIASAFLFFLNRSKPDSRSMEAIWDDVSVDLLREDYSASRASADKVRKEGGRIVGHVWNFLQQHPWETNGLINMVGAGSHMTSAMLLGRGTEALAALSTLTAMAITTFVPEKSIHEDYANAMFAPVDERITEASLHHMEKHSALLQPFFTAGKKLTDWIQKKPLQAASVIQLAANSGYGIAALNRKDAEGNRRTDMGLLVSSGTYITGNAFQAIARKNDGPSYDDVISTVAQAISSQTDWIEKAPDKLQARIVHIAEGLAQEPEIHHSRNQLAAGIMHRLRQERPTPDNPHAIIERFIPTEKAVLKKSPFISPHLVESALGNGGQVFAR